MKLHKFADDFVWGTATASYQVEGSGDKDDRGRCIWDDFSHIPGKVYMNADGSVACDQYHHIEDDIQLMSKLGFTSYRFSISWPRIFPDRTSGVNMQGIAYYRHICDLLHEHGMTACATMYHWDLPSYLQEYGGWSNRGIVDDFLKYAETLFTYLGNSVDMWITFNEPYCIAYLGYLEGVHAPGHCDIGEATAAIHHLNLAHGRTVRLYRSFGFRAPIGITWNLSVPRPADRSDSAFYAVRIATALGSQVFTMPAFEGKYPEILSQELGISFPVMPGDMDDIKQPIDFVGVNYYSEDVVSYDPGMPFHFRKENTWQDVNDMGWPVVPYGLLRILRWIYEVSNKLPIYITENGYPDADALSSDGHVHDRMRIDYLQKHIEIAEMAIEEGIMLKGYYFWSFIDNYEWSFGYSKRFGLVYCDFSSLRRFPKDSSYFIRDVISGYGFW